MVFRNYMHVNANGRPGTLCCVFPGLGAAHVVTQGERDRSLRRARDLATALRQVEHQSALRGPPRNPKGVGGTDTFPPGGWQYRESSTFALSVSFSCEHCGSVFYDVAHKTYCSTALLAVMNFAFRDRRTSAFHFLSARIALLWQYLSCLEKLQRTIR